MDARAHGAGGAPWHKRRCANGQSAIGSQAPVGASLEHLVQCSIANPALQPDHIASLGKCAVQAEEPARSNIMMLIHPLTQKGLLKPLVQGLKCRKH